jgi:hypothetical protein
MLIVGVIVVSLLLGLVTRIFASLIVPLAIVAGVGLILYSLINRKALGSSGRRYLP